MENQGNDVDDLKFGIGDALGTGYFFLEEQMTPQQLDYLRRTREFVDHEVLPVINGYWERAEPGCAARSRPVRHRPSPGPRPRQHPPGSSTPRQRATCC
jgi:hypothetical protein